MESSKKNPKNNTNVIQNTLDELYNANANKELLCVYHIMLKFEYISTNNIIKLALAPDAEKSCQDCVSADKIYRALQKLQELGLIASQIQKGGYTWQIT